MFHYIVIGIANIIDSHSIPCRLLYGIRVLFFKLFSPHSSLPVTDRVNFRFTVVFDFWIRVKMVFYLIFLSVSDRLFRPRAT